MNHPVQVDKFGAHIEVSELRVRRLDEIPQKFSSCDQRAACEKQCVGIRGDACRRSTWSDQIFVLRAHTCSEDGGTIVTANGETRMNVRRRIALLPSISSFTGNSRRSEMCGREGDRTPGAIEYFPVEEILNLL